jgi:uncharacterized glyoxalase superfamily protein PhnB
MATPKGVIAHAEVEIGGAVILVGEEAPAAVSRLAENAPACAG